MPTVKDLAYKYHSKGWSVFPLYEYSKRPLAQYNYLFPEYTNLEGKTTKGWKPLQERQGTDEEMKSWFIDNEATGIALVTGAISDIITVDVDSYKEGGLQIELDSPLKAQTGRGGTHLFFKYQDDIKNVGFREGVNIEIKSDGGYVVLPGSKVKYDDKILEYTWLSTKVQTDLSDLPTISASQLAPITKAGDNKETPIADLLQVDKGYQHNSLRTLINKMLNRFPESEWSIACKTIHQFAKEYKPPVPPREVDALIRDCQKFIKANPNQNAKKEEKEPVINIYRGQEIVSAYDDMVAKSGDGISTTYPLLDKYFKFQPQHITLVAASTFVGKTLFTINMAYRMAMQGTKVAYFSLEMGLWVTSKIKKIMPADAVMPNTLQLVESEDYLTGKQVIKTLDQMPDLDVVFIDHTHYLKREGRGLEGIDDLIMQLQFIAKARHIPVCLISHLRKLNEDRPPLLDDLRDTSYLQQVPSVILMLHRPRNSDDEIVAGAPEMKRSGYVYVRKNRMTGDLKAERFVIGDNEEFIMEDQVQEFQRIVAIDDMLAMTTLPEYEPPKSKKSFDKYKKSW